MAISFWCWVEKHCFLLKKESPDAATEGGKKSKRFVTFATTFKLIL